MWRTQILLYSHHIWTKSHNCTIYPIKQLFTAAYISACNIIFEPLAWWDGHMVFPHKWMFTFITPPNNSFDSSYNCFWDIFWSQTHPHEKWKDKKGNVLVLKQNCHQMSFVTPTKLTIHVPFCTIFTKRPTKTWHHCQADTMLVRTFFFFKSSKFTSTMLTLLRISCFTEWLTANTSLKRHVLNHHVKSRPCPGRRSTFWCSVV